LVLKTRPIIYIGEFDFGVNQSAATLRILNNCKSIQLNENLSITLLGFSNSKISSFEGFKILNTAKGYSLFSRIINYTLRGIKFINILRKEKTTPEILIYYGSSSRILLPLMILCKIKRIKLVVDVVEWYEYSHLPLGKWGPLALDVHLAMKYLIPKTKGVIAISTFLEDYYKPKLSTIRIPILIDKSEFDSNKVTPIDFNKNYLHLVYAGYAGKKDLIYHVIDAVQCINKESKKIEFHILGMTIEEIEKVKGCAVGESIKAYGKLSRREVSSFLGGADFSVLFRPIERFSKAGFPTKFVESLSNSLPVLGNLTSDLKFYLKDSFNGMIVENTEVNSIIRALEKALALTQSQKAVMKKNAQITAFDNFDYKKYSEIFKEFFNTIDTQ